MIDKPPHEQDWGSFENVASRWQPRTHPINKDNQAVYLSVARMLGCTAIVCAIGSIVLSYLGKDVPNILVAIGSVAAGSLGSLFTHKN